MTSKDKRFEADKHTEHLKFFESSSMKASEETFIGQTTKLHILLYDCIGTSSMKQIDILLATYFNQLISFTKEISSSNHIILSTTTTGQGLLNENFRPFFIFNDFWGITSTNENLTFVLRCHTYLLQNSHRFIGNSWSKKNFFLFDFIKHKLLRSIRTSWNYAQYFTQKYWSIIQPLNILRQLSIYHCNWLFL